MKNHNHTPFYCFASGGNEYETEGHLDATFALRIYSKENSQTGKPSPEETWKKFLCLSASHDFSMVNRRYVLRCFPEHGENEGVSLVLFVSFQTLKTAPLQKLTSDEFERAMTLLKLCGLDAEPVTSKEKYDRIAFPYSWPFIWEIKRTEMSYEHGGKTQAFSFPLSKRSLGELSSLLCQIAQEHGSFFYDARINIPISPMAFSGDFWTKTGDLEKEIRERMGVSRIGSALEATSHIQRETIGQLLSVRLERVSLPVEARLYVFAEDRLQDSAVELITSAISGASAELSPARCASKGLYEMQSPTALSSNSGISSIGDYLYSLNEAARVIPFPYKKLCFELKISDAIHLTQKYPGSQKILVGKTTEGREQPVYFLDEDLKQHAFLLGKTGTGKSTLIKQMALSDIQQGRGVAVLDPHGDLVSELLETIPEYRRNDVLYFNPSDPSCPYRINLLEAKNDVEADFVVQEAIAMLYRLYDPWQTGIIGPRFETWFRNGALAVLSYPKGCVYGDVMRMFLDDTYREVVLRHVKDRFVKLFWEGEYAKTSDFHRSEILGWFTSKFSAFVHNRTMARVMGCPSSNIHMSKIMNDKTIFLANLSKGMLGEINSKILGTVLNSKLAMAGLSRANVPVEKRVPFRIYLDEFHSFTTANFVSYLSEARKYGISFVLATQHLRQLGEATLHSVLGNVGSLFVFRISNDDAERIQMEFQPDVSQRDIVSLPNYHVYARMLVKGRKTYPLLLKTLLPRVTANRRLQVKEKQMSQTQSKISSPVFLPNHGVSAPEGQKAFVADGVERRGER